MAEQQKYAILEALISGRRVPYIYAFSTNTIPNYLKIGDTFRSVTQRLNEWRFYYPNLEQQGEFQAVINDNIYFRDHAVHQYLEMVLGKTRLQASELAPEIYYSREFFKDTNTTEIAQAIADITSSYHAKNNRYTYYNSKNRIPQNQEYHRGATWQLRPNQQQVVSNFEKAVAKGRTNLLMYAVMRW